MIPAERFVSFARELFHAAGLPEVDAQVLADSVIDSSLAGHDSHGVMLIERYAREVSQGLTERECKIDIERETPNTARINARNSHGHIAGRKITQIAIDKAKAHGVSTVTAHNLGHVGRLGTYVEIAAAHDCVALTTINNHSGATWLAPFGGSDRRLSPNPFGIGAPTGGEYPLVLDMSASTVAVGKCIVATAHGQSIPLGWILDNEGKPCTDPSRLIGPPAGALLPLGDDIGGHKGYALAFMMDVLGGALSAAGCSRHTDFDHRNGLFLTVIRIENFVELADFKGEVDRLIEWVKASPRVDSAKEILFPGEFEARARIERKKNGIPIPDSLAQSLVRTAETFGVRAL